MEGITGTSCTRKRAGTPWHTSPPFGRCTSQLAPSCTRSHTENTGGLISTIRCNFLTVLPHFCLGWLEHSSLVLALHLPGSTAPETSLHCSLGTSPHTSRGTDSQTGSCRGGGVWWLLDQETYLHLLALLHGHGHAHPLVLVLALLHT